MSTVNHFEILRRKLSLDGHSQRGVVRSIFPGTARNAASCKSERSGLRFFRGGDTGFTNAGNVGGPGGRDRRWAFNCSIRF